MRPTPAAADALVLENQWLASELAGAWVDRIPGWDYDDLRQECLLQMLIAARGWDHERLDFSTWAWLCMERRLRRIQLTGDLIKIPSYLAPLLAECRRQIASGQSPQDVVDTLDCTARRRQLVREALKVIAGQQALPDGYS